MSTAEDRAKMQQITQLLQTVPVSMIDTILKEAKSQSLAIKAAECRNLISDIMFKYEIAFNDLPAIMEDCLELTSNAKAGAKPKPQSRPLSQTEAAAELAKLLNSIQDLNELESIEKLWVTTKDSLIKNRNGQFQRELAMVLKERNFTYLDLPLVFEGRIALVEDKKADLEKLFASHSAQRRVLGPVEPRFINPQDERERWSGRGKTPVWLVKLREQGIEPIDLKKTPSPTSAPKAGKRANK